MSEYIEFRAVIKFLVKKGLSNQNVKEELESVYGEGCVGDTFIKKMVCRI